MCKEENMAILDKNALAGYFLKHYQDKYNRKVSPIKFQKGMYFLFAFWAQYANKMKDAGVAGKGESTTFDLQLFDAEFEAWQYGPVDRELYGKYNADSIVRISSEQLFKGVSDQIADTVASYIDDMLEQVYDVNDFSLVDISHEDEVWQSTYDKNPAGNGSMVSEAIIEEYIQRA